VASGHRSGGRRNGRGRSDGGQSWHVHAASVTKAACCARRRCGSRCRDRYRGRYRGNRGLGCFETTTTAPSEIFSPRATRISFTTPAADDGTSIVALSDSRVTRASSTLTTSPTMTQMSITGTSW
jgi:hypothetical protein